MDAKSTATQTTRMLEIRQTGCASEVDTLVRTAIRTIRDKLYAYYITLFVMHVKNHSKFQNFTLKITM